MLLILFGVGFFVGLSHLDVVGTWTWNIVSLFTPLIVGGMIAFVLNVPMHFFEGQFDRFIINGRKAGPKVRKMRGPVAMVITLAIFILSIYFIGSVIFPNLVDAVKNLAIGVMDNYPTWLEWLSQHKMDTSIINEMLAKVDTQMILSQLQSNWGEILDTASEAAGSIVGILSNMAFGLIFAIYILLNKRKLGHQSRQIAYAYLKKEWADEICDVASLSYKTFAGFISGQCLEAVILGSLFCVSLLIGGFPYAIPIGVIIGAMSLIPYVGAFIGLVFGILMIAVEEPSQLLWFIILFFVVQQIEGNLIYPKVVGGSVGLPAIWTLLAVVVGGSVSGIFGMIVFIPLFSVLYALLRRSVYSRLRGKKIKVS
ncbi:MAG: AI-2E family transporter [Firmicutes bacterium]|nr:AI-2E family transporter [Bacillota bacterium]